MVDLHHDRVIDAHYIVIFLDFLKLRGIDPAPIMTACQFSEEKFATPHTFLTRTECLHFLDQVLKHVDEPGIGLAFGAYLNITNHGFLGYAIMCSEDLRHAINLVLRFLKIRTQLVKLTLRESNDNASIVVDVLLGDDRMRQFLLEILASNLIAMMRSLLPNTDIKPECNLKYDAPVHAEMYTDMLKIPIRFSAQENSVTFNARNLKEPIPSADKYALSLVESQLTSLLDNFEEDHALERTIAKLIRTGEGYHLSLEDTAKRLHMSSRTLRRKLKEKDTSFREIKEKVYQDAAKDYLKNSELSINEIAFLLGYENPANFINAFKRWFGLTPSAFRN